MVYFALNRAGFDRMPPQALEPGAIVWANHGVVTADELTALRARGVAVTNFTGPVKAEDKAEMEEALDTIRLHHPKEEDISVVE